MYQSGKSIYYSVKEDCNKDRIRSKLQAERSHSVTRLRANSAIELRMVQIELAPDTPR